LKTAYSEESFVRLGTVSHFCLKTGPLLHAVHGSRFRDDRFTGIKFHLNSMNVVAQDLVIKFMALFEVGTVARIFGESPLVDPAAGG
jgi:hypothetical protein